MNRIYIVLILGFIMMNLLGTEIKFYSEAEDNWKELPSLWGVGQKVAESPIFSVSKEDLEAVEIINETNSKRVIFQLNDIKKQEFSKITSELVGKKMAFVFDGVVFMNPVVRSPIMEGKFLIDLGEREKAFEHLVAGMQLDDLITETEAESLQASRKRSLIYIVIMSLFIIVLIIYIFNPVIGKRSYNSLQN